MEGVYSVTRALLSCYCVPGRGLLTSPAALLHRFVKVEPCTFPTIIFPLQAIASPSNPSNFLSVIELVCEKGQSATRRRLLRTSSKMPGLLFRAQDCCIVRWYKGTVCCLLRNPWLSRGAKINCDAPLKVIRSQGKTWQRP